MVHYPLAGPGKTAWYGPRGATPIAISNPWRFRVNGYAAGIIGTTSYRSTIRNSGRESPLPGVNKIEVTLNLRADLVLLPVATSFVEKSALAFGLDEPEALALTLAAEEVFAYLCRVAAPGREVHMHCRGRGYYVEQDFLFQARDFNMRAFNLTAAVPFDDHAGMEETGLLIASRMVDRFRFSEEDRGLRLVLVKEKSYPELSHLQDPAAKPLTEFSMRPPDPEELKLFVRRINQDYPRQLVPSGFAFPGKVVDMVASGEYHAIIAADRAGHIGGGLVWRWDGSHLVEFFGPYVIQQPEGSGIRRAIVDACIAAVARTQAVGLINRYPSPDLPAQYFELLGNLTLQQSTGPAIQMGAYYRHLTEDAGLAVWAPPDLEAFLRREYGRLFFAREIRTVRDEGESLSPFSVLSAELDRAAGRGTLHPVWWGKDFPETLRAYLDTLVKEGFLNLFFEMDLGKAWHCHFAPALLDLGFEPRLVLPYAGKGDLVVFQHKAGGTTS
jgi:hypothetical protein